VHDTSEATMGKLTKTIAAKGAETARKAYEKLETRILVAEGRKAVRGKAQTVAKVSRKATRAGLIVGALAAAGVVAHEVRRRRKPD
jgi:CO dehydrogenase/acetyl-CoA synthase epsilon subunit